MMMRCSVLQDCLLGDHRKNRLSAQPPSRRRGKKQSASCCLPLIRGSPRAELTALSRWLGGIFGVCGNRRWGSKAPHGAKGHGLISHEADGPVRKNRVHAERLAVVVTRVKKGAKDVKSWEDRR